jgi:hypothetical protein
MAEAFKCDRCNDFQEGKPVAVHTFKSGALPSNVEDQWCDKCQASFGDWRNYYRKDLEKES